MPGSHSQTRAGSRLDSLMHWTDGARFDTARAIGERLLRHDSIRDSHVIALLDDYEAHPDRYHDGSYREPPAEKREDYIRFYRTQAENFVAAARQIPER